MTPSTNGAANIDPDMLKLIEAAHNIRNNRTDTELINAYNVIMSRGGSLLLIRTSSVKLCVELFLK